MQYVYITSFFSNWILQRISIMVILIFCLNSPTKCPWLELKLLKLLFLLKKKCIAKLVKYNTSNNKLIKDLDLKSF